MLCEETEFDFAPIKLNPKSLEELEHKFLEDFYKSWWSFHSEPEIALCFLVELYFKKARYEDGVATLERLLDLEPHNPEYYYKLACLYSCLKNKRKTLQALQSAIQKGFSDTEKILGEEAFRFFKDDEDFQNLIRNLT